MKKEGILLAVLFLILFLAFSVNAQEADLSKDGYKCLKKEINDKGCSALSLEEKVFSVLSTEKCKAQLISAKKTDNCFGTGSSCDVKETAQAIMALYMQNSDVSSYVTWLLAQNKTSTNIDWLLQIDTSSIAATCTINSTTSPIYTVQIGENEKLSGGNTPCFSIDNEYRIKIKSNCYDQELEISCNQDFSTTLLFQKQGPVSPFHVLDTGKSKLAGEIIIEKVNSLCFETPCNYEASLWATFVLDLVEEDVSSYLPYLIALADTTQNKEYLPESFLYFLTADLDYLVSLKAKQKGDSYWSESGNRYYDTAVALFPFSSDSFEEKTNAIAWLEDEQDSQGCWDNKDIVNTAFLLYSLWPQETEPTLPNCGGSGYDCMLSSSCVDAQGNELANYSGCPGFDICCSESEPQPSCSDAGGTICESDEVCDGSIITGVSDIGTCCDTTCSVPELEPSVSECLDNSGACKSSCDNNEKEVNFECQDTSDFCCVDKTKKDLTWLWIVLFVILFLGAVIFLFRKKIFKKKEEVPGVSPGLRRPGMPPRRMPPRRPRVPPTRPTRSPAPAAVRPVQKPIQPAPVKKAHPKEDVFKKLKEMGK